MAPFHEQKMIKMPQEAIDLWKSAADKKSRDDLPLLASSLQSNIFKAAFFGIALLSTLLWIPSRSTYSLGQIAIIVPIFSFLVLIIAERTARSWYGTGYMWGVRLAILKSTGNDYINPVNCGVRNWDEGNQYLYLIIPEESSPPPA